MKETPYSYGQFVEIRHNNNFDVIVNMSADDLSQTLNLAKMVENGIPTSWVNYDPRPKTHQIDPDYTSHQDQFFVDDLTSPQFIAKIRHHTSLTPHVDLSKAGNDESIRNFLLSGNSLLNEFKVSRRIKDILRTAQAKQIAMDFGYEDIVFVEPLVGLIDKRSRQKIIVYNFVKGFDIFESEYAWERIGDSDDPHSVENQLGALFAEHGISGRDFGGHQFVLNKNDVRGTEILYIVDAEHLVLRT